MGLNHEKCIGCKECVAACPFEIPRYDSDTDKVYKCDLCLTRLQADLPPACVKACPTGALTFGDKDDMLKMAYKRAKELGGDANVYGDKFVGGTHVIYVLQEKPEVYDDLPVKPQRAAVGHGLEGSAETAEPCWRRAASWPGRSSTTSSTGRRPRMRTTTTKGRG